MAEVGAVRARDARSVPSCPRRAWIMGAGRRALCRDSARDARHRRLRNAAQQLGALFREAAASVLDYRCVPLALSSTKVPGPIACPEGYLASRSTCWA